MTVTKKAVLAAYLVVSLGGVLWAMSRASAAPEPQTGPYADTGLPHGYMGSASCSARACHGGDAPVSNEKAVALQNEYTHIAMYDKHAQAYSALLGDQAKKIAENLAPTNKDGKKIEAHLDARCLACHATPASAWGMEPGKEVSLTAENWHKGGVSCEACHGPANRPDKPWFALHTAADNWRKLFNKEPEKKSAFGFTNLTTPSAVARTCAGCHVGAPADPKNQIPARDCNHDIMGAGHPRLNFELASFLDNMPPHWNVKLKGESAAKDAKTWLDGRVVSAKAALDLLADRAERAKEKKAPWPELAEYRCYSCHTDLSNNWAKFRNEGKRPRGTLPYDTWYSSLLTLADTDLADRYGKLTLSMTRAEPGDVADQAKQLSKALDKLLDKDAPQTLSAILTKVDLKDLPRTWEDASQLALAIAARDRNSAPKLKDVEEVFKELQFPSDPPKWKGEGPLGITGPALDETKIKLSEKFSKLLGR